jgi:hypothetical protein
VLVVAPQYADQQTTTASVPNGARMYKDVPPLREGLFAPDQQDFARVEYVRRLWHSQDMLLRGRDKQIEENIRMLCGQQWAVWSELLGRYVDIARYMTDEERRWRQMPVMNRLLLWFMLTHARMTENPPIITFQPATGDRIDAELAETMDLIWKTLWQQAGMADVIDSLTSWIIPAGRAHLKSRIDPEAGDLLPLVGPGELSLVNGDGSPLGITRSVQQAPYDEDGNILGPATMSTDGSIVLPQPRYRHEGAIVVDALSPLEVRGEWGAMTPWQRKNWHIHRTYLTPEQVYHAYGVEVEPEVFGDEAASIQELQRLQFGSGFFGQASGKDELQGSSSAAKEGYVEVLEGWFRPCNFPGMEQTPESPGGRLLTVTRTKVLRDGPRYAAFPRTSPIHTFDFVRVPGRPSATSPQEMMNGPQRTRNRIYGQILANANLHGNPIQMIDKAAGIPEGTVVNKPGTSIQLNFGVSGEPIRYVKPPTMSTDVWRTLELLTKEMDDIGSIPGAEGAPQTVDPSGELVKELRFNSDRFIGPTQRRTVTVLSWLAEDWQQMIPIIWDQGKILRVAGDDNVERTISVMPELFEQGRINAVPDIESMLPESRGERQQRIHALYAEGAFGPPGTPMAVQTFLELAKFPHLSRNMLPGGIDRITAQQENGKLILGTPAAEIPVLEWYDHEIHLAVLEQYMKSPEYLKQPIEIQEQFVMHRAMHIQALQIQAMQQLRAQVLMAGAGAAGEAAGADANQNPPAAAGAVQQ